MAADLGTLLRVARGERSLQSVASLLNVTPMTVRAWEQGFSRPKVDRASALAAFLDVPEVDVLAMIAVPLDDAPAVEAERVPLPHGRSAGDAFELFRAWWGDVPARLGPATCKQYRHEVFAACAELGKHPLSVLARDLEKHLGEMRPQYASLRRAALLDFFRFLERKGYRSDNPLASLPSPKIGRKKVRRGLSEEELFRLWNAALLLGSRRRPPAALPGDALGWAILAQCGLLLRPGELVRLTRSSVKLNGSRSYVEVTQTKTGNDRIVPVVGIARAGLEGLMASTSSNRLIPVQTTRYWELVHAAGELAGLPPEKCRPYALRHTGATFLAERGVPPRVIAEILGHSDLRSMWVYTQPGDRDVIEALRKLSE